MSRLSYKSLLIILLFLLIPIVLLLRINQKPEVAEAGWWNDSWTYRKAVNIGYTGTELTDFQVSFDIGTSALVNSGKMQSDCDDIRITDSRGNLLPHWIEENNPGCNSPDGDTKIWLKAPTIPSDGATIYIYYGNSSATNIENGDNVFEFFDDFNDASIDDAKWTMITNGEGGSYQEIGGNLELTSSNNLTGSSNAKSIFTFTNNYFIHWRRYNTDGHYNDLSFGYGDLSVNWHPKPSFGYTCFVQDNNNYSYRKNGSVIGTESFDGPDAGQWAIYKTYYDDSGNWNWYYDTGSGFTLFDLGRTDTSYLNDSKNIFLSRGGYSGASYGGTSKFDYFFVRQYAVSDPSSSLASEETGTAPIAYWKFDEGVGSTAFDAAGNNHGNISGATWQDESMCVSDKCLSFDGSNDYVEIQDNNSINFDYNQNFSINFWLKAPSTQPGTGSAYRIIDKTHSTQARYPYTIWLYDETHATNPNKIIVARYDGDDNPSVISDTTFNDNQWHHIVFQKNDSNLYIYVDGQLDKQASDYTDSSTTNTGTLHFGNMSANNLNPFTGFIDEVKIYPYARTPDQILQDYNLGAISLGGRSLGGGPEVGGGLANGLVAYYNMDTGTGTTIADLSGNNNTGTFGTGDSAPAWSTGKFGGGISYDETQKYVEILDLSNQLSENAGTISMWFNLNQNVADLDHRLHFFEINQNNKLWYQPLGYNQIFWTTYNHTPDYEALRYTASWTAGNWHHIVVNWNLASSKKELYFDGQLIGTSSEYTGMKIIEDMYIGNSRQRTSNDAFDGLIDEVRVYNRALSASEVKDLYEYAPGPILHLKMDENQGTTAYDSSGNGNNGTLINSPTWTTGKYGSSLSFNNSARHVKITSNSQLQNNRTSFGAWIKFNNFSNTHAIISKTNASDYTLAHLTTSVYNCSANTIGAIVNISSTYYCAEYPTSNLNTNQWYYLSGIYDGEKISLYVNGTQVDSTSISGNINSSSAPLCIGQEAGATDCNEPIYFDGLIDDVRIYNYARTPQQILQDMHAANPNSSNSTLHPIAHWSFDRGVGNTAFDAAGNNHGNLGPGTSAPTWTNNGKIGKALSFASNDYINLNSQLLTGTSYSTSLWFKTSSGNAGIYTERDAGNEITGQLYITSGNLLSFIVRNSSGQDILAQATTDYTDNSWHHAVGIRDGTSAYLYVDGTKVDTDTDSNVTDSITVETYTIGSYQPSGGFFNGLIDEVKIYNYALSADEVALDYNQGQTAVMGSFSSGTGNTAPASSASQIYCVPGSTDPCSPPVAEWNFNEGVGTTAYDTSTNANHGVFGAGDSSPTWTRGHIGSALSFDGTNDYVSKSSYSLSSPYSIQFWFNPTQWTHGARFAGFSSYKNGIMTVNGPSLQFNDCPISVGTAITNTWQYISYTNNGSNVYLYINGIYKGSCGSGTVGNLTSIYLGKNPDGLSTGWPFKIDNFSIYDYARTPAQIAWDYNGGKPIAHYKLNECQGTTVHSSNDTYDSSLNGTINIGASGTQTTVGTCSAASDAAAWSNGATGKLGASLNFDGSDDYINAGDISELNSTSAFTISLWMKQNTLDVNSWIFSKSNESSTRLSIVTWIDGNMYFEPDSSSNRGYFDYSTAINAGQWHHITMVFDGSAIGNPNRLKAYIDGDQQTLTLTGTIPATTPDTSGQAVTLGKSLNEPPAFSGQIDDVRIYNYALTSDQVKTLYNGGAVNFSN